MEIMDSPLGDDIRQITTNGSKSGDTYWRADIKANGQTREAFKVLMMDQLQDFEYNFSDETSVTLVFGVGTYAYQIFPYLDDLEITLYRDDLYPVTGIRDPNASTHTQSYRATLINPTAPVMTSILADEEAMNLRGLIELEFQLQDFYIEQLRSQTFGTIFRDESLGNLVKHVLTLSSSLVDVDERFLPKGVDMVPPANEAVIKQTIIPQGTALVNVPQYLHEVCGGIYPTGFSYYLNNNLWYVFPTYDTQRFERSRKTLTVVRIPSNRMPNVEFTYLENGNNLKVLVTGETFTTNEAERMIANSGNGVRFAAADKIVEGFVEVKDNRALISRGDNNNEFITIERKTKVNNAMLSDARITTNQMVEYSKLSARDGSLLMMEWENSNPDLLIPGMPVKVLYLDETRVEEVFGTLIKAQHFTGLRGQGMTATRHSTTTVLAVFVTRKYSLD